MFGVFKSVKFEKIRKIDHLEDTQELIVDNSAQSTQESAEDPLWNEVHQKYIVGDLVGEGAYGKVFDGVCKRDQQRVAIKLIEDFSSHEYSCVKVLREISILKHLSNSQFVPKLKEVIASKSDDRHSVFLVMEHFGQDFRKFIRHDASRLSSEQLKKVFYNVLRCIDFMHCSNVIHRDLKPANILIDPQTLQVKVCDFGLSRTLPESVTAMGSGFTKRFRDKIAQENFIQKIG